MLCKIAGFAIRPVGNFYLQPHLIAFTVEMTVQQTVTADMPLHGCMHLIPGYLLIDDIGIGLQRNAPLHTNCLPKRILNRCLFRRSAANGRKRFSRRCRRQQEFAQTYKRQYAKPADKKRK